MMETPRRYSAWVTGAEGRAGEFSPNGFGGRTPSTETTFRLLANFRRVPDPTVGSLR